MCGAGGFVAVNGGLGARIQLRLEPDHAVGEPGNGRGAVGDGQADGSRWHVQDILLGEHSAPGIAEDVKGFQPECAHHGAHLGHRAPHCPQIHVGRAFGVSAAKLIPEDDFPFAGQSLQR